MAKPAPDADTVGRVMDAFDQDNVPHKTFTEKVEKWYRSYRGIIEENSKAIGWTNKQHPAYVFQVVETMIASALEPNPGWKVKARPKLAPVEQVEQEAKGAKAMEILLAEQADIDRIGEKQRPFVMQGLIAGVTAAKTYWQYNAANSTRLDHVPTLVNGVHVPMLQPVRGVEILQDGPTMEVVDVRDLIWHEAATTLDTAMRVTHRCWYSLDELRQLEAAGVYANVDQLNDTRDYSGDQSAREQVLFSTNRAKNQIEVLEHWFMDKGEVWVITVANRNVCLTPGGKAKPNPFWHGQYPFVATSSMPDLFRVSGMSEVDVISDIQEMLWTLMNQRLDNLEMLNNAIAVIRSDVDDPDAFEWAPRERWIVDDINQVKILEVTPLPAEISLSAEAALRNDLQNISGGMPLLSGSDQQMDSNTATAASIFTSLAQRRVAAKKMNFTWAMNRVGEQWIALNQQFIREDRALEIIGPDGAPLVHRLSPLDIQGRFHIKVESMDESLMRQERRAEAQAKLQVAVSAALPFAQTNSPLNLAAFMDDYLEAFGVQDTARYYTAKNPLPNMQQPGGGPPQQGGAPVPPTGAQGVTAPQAVDANAPSHSFSQSPVAAQQRMGAMAGGPVNQ